MMTEQAIHTQPLVERDALHPSYYASYPEGYEDVYIDEAYPMVQRQIAEYADFQKKALASQQNERIAAAMAYEASLKKTIQKQIALGYLLNTCVIGPGRSDEEIRNNASAYLQDSLNRYRQYSLDPRIAAIEDSEKAEYIPTVGVNITQEQFEQQYPNGYIRPAHITEVRTEDLSVEDAHIAHRFEEMVAHGFDSLKRRMKKLGSRTVELLGVTYNSGEITLPPTKILPTVEKQDA